MYLITNHHVIEPFLESGEGELVQAETTEGVLTGRSKIRVFYDSDDFEEAYPVAYDEIKDLAVLKLGAATSKRTPLPLCSPTDNMVGSTIYAVGYPGLAENVFADATTTWGPSDVSVTSGSISRLLTTSGTGQMRLQIDCVIRHGNSGGPLVNEDGQVLGIAVSSVSDEEDSSMYYGVNIDEVIPYLKQYDVPYVLQEAGATQSSSETSLAEGTAPAGDTIVVPESTEEDPKESSGGVPAAVWVVIGVAVAAVAGVVIFLLLQKGKKTPCPSPACTTGARSGACPSESACAALFGPAAQRRANPNPGQADPHWHQPGRLPGGVPVRHTRCQPPPLLHFLGCRYRGFHSNGSWFILWYVLGKPPEAGAGCAHETASWGQVLPWLPRELAEHRIGVSS